MKYQIRVTPTVVQEIEDIYFWIKNNAPRSANKWFNELYDVIYSLEEMPLRYAVAPESKILNRDIRQCVYKKNYRILYEVVKNTVYIYHIRHTSRLELSKENFHDL